MKRIFLGIFLLTSCTVIHTDKQLQDFLSEDVLPARNISISPTGKMLDTNGNAVTGIVRKETEDGIFLLSVRKGALNGTTRHFATSGALTGEAEYKNNLLDGVSRRYFLNGYIAEKTYYKNGVKNGVETRYMGEPFWGRKRDETTYAGGIRHGLYIRYGGSSKSFSQYYENGILNGPYVAFFPDGKIMKTATYVNGLRQGKVISYHQYGGVALEVNVVDDKEEGIEKHYGRDGKLSMEVNYKKGMIVPPVIGYYPDGGKRFVITEIQTEKPRYHGYCLTPEGKKVRDFDDREEKYGLNGINLWGCAEVR